MIDPVSLQLAFTVASQGLRMYADFADRAAKGELTDDEVDLMAERLGLNIGGLREDIVKARAEGR